MVHWSGPKFLIRETHLTHYIKQFSVFMPSFAAAARIISSSCRTVRNAHYFPVCARYGVLQSKFFFLRIHYTNAQLAKIYRGKVIAAVDVNCRLLATPICFSPVAI